MSSWPTARRRGNSSRRSVDRAGSIAANPTLYQPAPFDMARDFTPIALVGRVPVVLAVTAQGSIDSLAKLIAAAKAAPKSVTYTL
ncbi:tripartite tricarboxylate transporter substrate-binding protein [Aquabacterium sp.]|uniref:tripartite tricarboxylate transporter substrate-binding protein n=1 Tax=Aquabacterium sp. TaxID=1872578 RepID=UPI002BEBB51C|nr:tripartite tricarboxylate transporter substrate-binding protein [Aquabacterium sp.]HSW03799.1 tripartite tricarboxylate transporter substrate-binding protein [Aquabacterium sp.]